MVTVFGASLSVSAVVSLLLVARGVHLKAADEFHPDVTKAYPNYSSSVPVDPVAV